MSRLFDALSRIEAREHGGDPPLFAARERTKRRWKRPWIPSTIAAVVIAGAGILALVAVSVIDISKLDVNKETLRPPQTETAHKTLPDDAGSLLPAPPPVQQPEASPPESTLSASIEAKPSIPPETGSGIGTRDFQQASRTHAVDVPAVRTSPSDAEIRIPDKQTGLHAPAGRNKAQRNRAEETNINQDPIPDVMEAQVMVGQGRIEEASRIYRAAWNRERDPVIGNNLAATLIMLKKPDEARGILEEAIKMSPEDKDLRYNLELVETMTQ